MSIFIKLSWFFKEQWKRYALACLTLAIISVLAMVPPWLTGRAVDRLEKGGVDLSTLYLWVLSFIGVAVAVYLLRVLWRLVLFGASYRLSVKLRKRLFQKFTRLSPQFYAKQRTGDLMARATNDVEAVEMTAGEGILAMFDGTMTGIIVISLMVFDINPWITLYSLIPWPIAALLMYLLGERLHDVAKKAQASFSKMNDHVQESLSGVRTLKSFHAEHYNNRQFDEIVDASSDMNYMSAKLEAGYEPIIRLTIASSFLIALGYGSYMVSEQHLSIGELTSFLMYLGYLIWPMFAVGWLLHIVQRGKAAYGRIEELHESKEELMDQGRIDDVKGFELELDIRSFKYDGATSNALENLSIHIPEGSCLGIVGPTGAGKTSLIKLLLRQFRCRDGYIKLNGELIESYRLETYFKQFAYVAQDPFLFSTEVFKNIALGQPEAKKGEVEEAACWAEVHRDILSFPDQYDTKVGERGITLSGGQKQRLSLARALLLDAPILVLDDVLSAVDAKTESEIISHLQTFRRGKTSIIISHRLSAVRDADCIIELNQGACRAQGNHDELMKQNGWYRKMVELQQIEEPSFK